jgi:PAS domain S-box-containing protein
MPELSETLQTKLDQLGLGTAQPFLQSSPDPIVIYDNVGQVLAINNQFTAVFGWERDELLGKRLDFVPPETEAETAAIIGKILKEGHASRFGTLRYTKDRTTIHVEISASAIYDDEHGAERQYMGALVILRDISDRKEAEQELQSYRDELEQLVTAQTTELRTRQDQLSRLIGNLPGIVYRCRNDQDWTMEYIAGQCYEITGYRPEQLIDNAEISFSDLQIAEEQESLRHIVDEALANQEPYEVVYTLISKDGELKTMWERGVGIFDESGALQALEGFITDITAPTEDRKALAESMAQSRAMLNTLPDLMFRVSQDGTYLDMYTPENTSMAFPSSIFIGRKIEQVLPQEAVAEAYEALAQTLETGAVQTVQYEIEPNEYSIIPRHYEARISKLNDEEVILLVRDITEQATTAEQLARQNEALDNLNVITQDISAELDLQAILTALCAGTAQLLEATSAYFSDWNIDEGTSTVLAEYFSEEANEKEKVSDLGVTYDMREDLGAEPEWIFAIDQYLSQTIDSPTLSPEEQAHLEEYGVQAVLSFPVILNGRALGLFEIYESRYKRVFTETEVELITSLVNHAAVAIEKAELFAQGQQELQDRIEAEQALREAQATSVEFQDKLNALLEINVALSEVTTLPELYEQAIIHGREKLGFDRLGLLLYDEDANLISGTFGTDDKGHIRDERNLVKRALEDERLLEVMNKQLRVKMWENHPIQDHGEIVGQGWNGVAIMVQDNKTVGWLAADNLIQQEPLKPYQSELLALYAGTLNQLIRRLQTQSVLQESEERNRIMVEQSPLAVIRWDMGFQVAEWNPAAEAIFGYSREEALGEHARLILTPEVAPLVDDIWQHLTNLTGGERSTNENVTAAGETILCEWYNTTLIDEDGQPIGVVSIVEDVTEQRRAEEALRESEERNRIMVEQSPLAVIRWDMGFQVAEWNPAAEAIFGYSREEALGEHARLILTPEVAPLVDDIWQHLTNLTGGERSTNENVTAAGETILCEWYNTTLIDEDGQPIGVVSIVEDVTEQQRAEEALRESEERTRALLNAMPDFIMRVDKEGTYQDVHFPEQFDIPMEPAELLGQNMVDMIPSDNRQEALDLIHQSIKDNEIRTVEYSRYHPETEQTTFYELRSAPTGSDEAMVIIRDITESKAAALELSMRQATVERLGEASLKLAKSQTIAREGLTAALQEITSEAAKAVQTARVSIWSYDTQEKALYLLDLYEMNTDAHSAGTILDSQTAPSYFKALAQERILIANDVSTHYSTQELLETYLQPLGITSMLDTFVRTADDIRGVVCLEHVGPQRDWTLEEQNFANSLADLTALVMQADDRRILEEQIRTSLERRSRQVRLSTQIAQQISSATELFELYQRVVELVKEQFGYYHTQLLQYNPALDAVALVVGYGQVGQQMIEMGHSIPMGSGIIGTAATTGKSVLISNVQEEPTWRAHPLLPDTRSELAVPIVFEDRVLGVLDIQDDRYGSLDAEDQILFEGLCGQIATAIESTRLRQSMGEQLKELNSLQRLMSRDAWQSYQATQESTELGYFFDRTEVKPIGTNGHSKLENEEAVVFSPITIRGETVGGISIQDTVEQPLAEEEQALLNAISLQVAEALENARLLEQTQKRAVELETVAQVSTASSTILEVDQLLKSVVDLTKSSFGLYHAHIYLYEEESRDMVLAAGAGEIGDIMVAEDWRIPLHRQHSLVARSARSQKGMVVSNTRTDPDFMPNPLLPRTRAELIVPMIAGDRLLGVLDLQSDRVNFFSQDDLRIHTTLASQVAIALQNANLFQEQRETAEKLREVDQLKSEFLASMSHELRTPLNSIIGFADVLLEGIDGELNDRMEEDVRLIRDGGQHLRALIGDILDMSKIEAGMMDLNYGVVDVASLANEVMATTRGLLTEKPVEASLFLDPRLETLEADRVRLVQVLLNLLSNAAKFTDEGEVALSMERQGENLFVSIKDSGIGIREEDIPQVFEQFRQIGGMALRKAGGTGLGMPITKKLVEMHGGKIWLESTFGSGTTFYFTIPLTKPEVAAETGQGYYG